MVLVQSSKVMQMAYLESQGAFSGQVDVIYKPGFDSADAFSTRVNVVVKGAADAASSWVEEALVAKAVQDVSTVAPASHLSLVVNR
jgi:hypothetical protein